MKRSLFHHTLIVILTALAVQQAAAEPRRSLLDSDPEVIYLKDHVAEPVILLVEKPANVYATKKGGTRLGVFNEGTKVELIGMTDKVYRVKGKARHAGVIGWVNPKLLSSENKNFIANLKSFYQRQILVNELVANEDIAIGMTLDEVSKSIGEPTETEVRQTIKGQSGKWDYIICEEQKHYRTVIDPKTRIAYRQLTHITTEEKSRTTVEFEHNVVTAITRKENKGPGKVRMVPIPIIFHW